MRRKAIRNVLVTVALAAPLVIVDSPAEAAFPGLNGPIICETTRDGNDSELVVMDPDGSDELLITQNNFRDGEPAFSADGKFIYWESFESGGSEVWRMNEDLSDPIRLTFNGNPEDRSVYSSPDSSQIVHHTTEFPAGVGHSSFEIIKRNANGTAPVRLTNNTFQDTQPAWSPDGQRIAFLSTRDGDFEIYTMDPNGGNIQRITNFPGEDAHPYWSPDGSKLVIHTRRRGPLELAVIDMTNPNPSTNVTILNIPDSPGGFGELFPSWSPDGTKLLYTDFVHAFTVSIPANFVPGSVAVLDVPASAVTKLTETPGFTGRCDWGRATTPDGTLCTITGQGSIVGTEGNDVICGSVGSDQIFGRGGNDKIYGSYGDDYLDGGAGNDTLWGGQGNDFLTGGSGADVLFGQTGNDRLNGEATDTSVNGGPGTDRCTTSPAPTNCEL